MYHVYIRPIIHFYEVVKISRKIIYISRRSLSFSLYIYVGPTKYDWRSCFSIVLIISRKKESEEA